MEKKHELLSSLKMMYENIENLPPSVLGQPISHYDFAAALILLYELHNLDSDDQEQAHL